MKAASISDIKEELSHLSPKELIEHCLRLTRYKKENKELLTYLLFEAHDEQGYVENIKKEIDEQFMELPKSNPYLNKKALRKILRSLNKYSKYMASKQSTVEMLIHFVTTLKNSGIRIHKSTALVNLYNQQIKKIETALDSLHEDLHYDYRKKLEELR